MRRHSSRPQRTLANVVEVRGFGHLSGADVCLRFEPAPPSSGVVFVRVDLPGRPRLPAHVDQVTGTARRTTIGHAPAQVALVEHVLAALAGLRIDNCVVELDASEPPGLDGSARGFVEALLGAGIVTQSEWRERWCVEEPVTLRAPGVTLTLHPPADATDPTLYASYFLDYGPYSSIGRQVFTQAVTPGVFRREIAPCRTFLLEAEGEQLRGQGLGLTLTTSDLIVFGARGPIDNPLRFANEPARHKVLDVVGDLSLFGADLCGHLIAYRSGHPLNVEMARVLHQMRVEARGRTLAA